MSEDISAVCSGQFRTDGNREVNRLGFGAMRIVSKFGCGPPAHPRSVRETLAYLPHIGVNLIDTADSYVNPARGVDIQRRTFSRQSRQKSQGGVQQRPVGIPPACNDLRGRSRRREHCLRPAAWF
jgi:hypothetical protein